MLQYPFDVEISKLMNIIINNFYSSKDIFIRELISNASDALNKLKHKSLVNNNIPISVLHIKIKSDKSSNTLTIEDSGIGMSKEDLINCLGTIAKSGTEEFAKNLESILKQSNQNKENINSDFIGNFGVGFYSVFLVADKVQVYTKHIDSEFSYLWESDAISGYSISEVESTVIDFISGTKIVLHIKSDQSEYLDDSKLSELIKKYSGFGSYPIYLCKNFDVNTNNFVTETTSEIKLKQINIDNSVNAPSEICNYVYEKINTEPIWIKSPSEISNDEYEKFYKEINSDFDTYAKLKHFKAEGTTDFVSILFCPKKAPLDMFIEQTRSNIKLYLKKVLITDKCDDLYPKYFSFIKGIVDCNDLPLNASRELVQKSTLIKQIRKTLVKKTIEMFSELAESNEDYKLFYNEFSKNIKFAIIEDEDISNKNKLLDLLRYHTSKSNDEQYSLEKYNERMLETQSDIYYINSDSLTNADNHPLIEKLKFLGIEVIYMPEPIDEYLMQIVQSYKDKKFFNVAKDKLNLSNFIKSNYNLDSESENFTDSEATEMCELFKTVLGDLVENVVVSDKLVSQPAIVRSEIGVSASMERLLKAEGFGNNQMLKYASSKKVLEINLKHNLIKKLKSTQKIVVNSEDNSDSKPNDQSKENYIKVIYQMSLLAGGYQIENINGLLSKLYDMIDYKHTNDTIKNPSEI